MLDVGGLVYYLSAAGILLFLTVQSIEKEDGVESYDQKTKKGSFMALYTLVVIAAVIVLNLIVGKLPAKYLKHDLSSSKILTLGDTTRDILAQLDRDVTIHIVADPNSVDERIPSFVELYKDLSPHISVEANDPVLHPDVLALLDTEPGNLIVSCESTGKRLPFHLTI